MRLPRIRAIGPLSFAFNCTQVVIRFGSIILSLGALAYIAWLYNYWRSEPTTQVDALFPSFFPVCVFFFALVTTYINKNAIALMLFSECWLI